MENPIAKRLVIEVADQDHRAVKSACAESGESIASFVRGAIAAELQRRSRLLHRSHPNGPVMPMATR